MSNRRVESFIVRIVVREDEAAATEGWSGRIQHITTGNEYQFKELQELLSFMSTHLRECQDDVNALALYNDFFSGG